MKKLIIPGIVLFAATLAFMAFNYPVESLTGYSANPPQLLVTPAFPDSVGKILETSCFDCHSDASSNEKARTKINFTKWNNLKDAQKVGKTQDISDVVQKGDMPPAKYTAKFPERALGQEQKDLIIKWAAEESEKLMGK